MRTVSSSFPAGAAVVASPSGSQRQRSCRGSLDVLRSASCGVSKLVASTRNVTLKVGLCAIHMQGVAEGMASNKSNEVMLKVGLLQRHRGVRMTQKVMPSICT